MDCEHERGGLGIGAGGAEEIRVVGWKDQADDEEAEDVEGGDAPENLAGSFWEGFAGIGRFCGGEADELGAGEGEGGGDENGAETFL